MRQEFDKQTMDYLNEISNKDIQRYGLEEFGWRRIYTNKNGCPLLFSDLNDLHGFESIFEFNRNEKVVLIFDVDELNADQTTKIFSIVEKDDLNLLHFVRGQRYTVFVFTKPSK